MIKLLTLLLLLILSSNTIYAADENLATFVSPIRNREYWRQGRGISFLTKQIEIINNNNIPCTWLLQYDALYDSEIIAKIKSQKNDEVGLFLEITPKLTKTSYVNYDQLNGRWEQADKLFLSAYEIEDRQKLIDNSFEKFKETFEIYPKSVGAWYIDGWSLKYMLQKYQITSALTLSDQYTTDGYQVWGQYLGSPYYPSQKAPIEPAQNLNDKLDLVKIQWAPRHPLLSYGIGPQYSNYSTQVNDYHSSLRLGNDYLKNLLNIYTNDTKGKISQITLGIEVSELNDNDLPYLDDEIKTAKAIGLNFKTMSDFSGIYKKSYPALSPSITISATTNNKKITFYQSPNYRLGILEENGNQKIIDLRFYNQSPYSDNDQTLPDKRQNLYRVVPAIFDSISLQNSFDVGKSQISVEENGIITTEKSFYSKPSTTTIKGKISNFSKIKVFIGKLIPDLRVSKIEGKTVFGLKTDPQTLIGFKNFIPGIYKYPFPILESFKNLNKLRHPKIDLYSRQEDELEQHKNQGKVITKNSSYGAEKLKEELSNNKIFENSYYIVN